MRWAGSRFGRAGGLAALVLFALGCSTDEGGGPGATSARDGAGLRIVEHGAGEAATARWSAVETEATPFAPPSGPPLHRVAGVRALPGERVAVAEAGSRRLLLFDGDGVLLDSAGGEGEGPGEFRLLVALHRFPGDSLAAWDAAPGRVTLFGVDDDSLALGRTARLEPTDSVPRPSLVGVLTDGSFLATGPTLGPGTTPEGRSALPTSVHRYAPDGAHLARLPFEVRSESYYLSANGGTTGYPALLARSTRALTAGGRILLAANERFELRFLTAEGETELVVRRTDPPTPVGPALARRARAAALEGVPEGPFREALEEQPLPGTAPAFERIFVDRDGRVWTEAAAVADGPWAPSTWTVHDADGSLLATAELPGRFEPMDAVGMAALGVLTDSLGVEQVLRLPLDTEP